METFDQIVNTLSLAMGAAWASGINLYATILTLGFMGITNNITLPPTLDILMDPMVLGAAGLMYCVEFFADKVPGVDIGWDALHTFIRIPAGVVLAAGAVGELTPAVGLAAAIVGGGVAAGSHATKAGTRVLINTSPEPFTNWTASIVEDMAVVTGIWTALHHPWIFFVCLALFVLVMVLILPIIWKGIKKIAAFMKNLFNQNSA